MNRFLSLTIFLLTLCACDSKKSAGTEFGPNRMSFNDRIIEFESVFSLTESDFEYGRMWGIALYPQNFSSIPPSEPSTYLYILLPDKMLGREIDLTAPLERTSRYFEIGLRVDGTEYEFYREGDEYELWFGEEEVHGSVGITSGTVKVEYRADTVYLLLDIVFSDGKRLTAAWDGPFVGKGPSSGTQNGPVYGAMQKGSLSSELRSGIYAAYPNPEGGKNAYLLLSPEDRLDMIDGEPYIDPMTFLVAEIPVSLLGQEIDLTQPLPQTEDKNNGYLRTAVFLRIDGYGLGVVAETDGWAVLDDDEADTYQSVTRGTFRMTKTEDRTSFVLDAQLFDGTSLAARWEGPTTDIYSFADYDRRHSTASGHGFAGRKNR